MIVSKSADEFKEFGSKLCPVCGHRDRCKGRADGGVTCFRERREHVNDFNRVSMNDTCCVYIPRDVCGRQRHTQRNGHAKRAAPPDLTARWRKLRSATADEQIADLAESLGVSVDSLKAIGVAYDADGCPVFPERSATGAIVGLCKRWPNGDKRVAKGEHRGLYIPENLHDVTGPVFCPEGASDVAALLTMGCRAVGRPNDTACASVLAELLTDEAEVVVVGENDEPGSKGAASVAKSVAGALGREVSVVFPPADVKDVRALLMQCEDPAKARDALLAMPRETVAPGNVVHEELETRRAIDVTPETTEWLWKDRFPLGKVSILAGDPGLGKSFLVLDIASRVSRGCAWPDARDVPQVAGDVLIMNGEDGIADTIVPRLKAADADLSRVIIVDGVKAADGEPRPVSLERDIATIGRELTKNPSTRLVIIDPVSAYFGASKDSHKDTEVRSILAPLAKLAENHRVAILLVKHLAKTSKATAAAAIYRVLGSMGFVGLSRAVWSVVKDNREEAARDSRLLLMVKNNLAPDPGGLAFRIAGGEQPAVEWFDGAVDQTADEAMAPLGAKDKDGRQGGTLREACDFLTRRLGNGPRKRKDVLRDAETVGFTARTMDRAANQLGVRLIRREWTLPESMLTASVCNEV